jgi:hypothetical protein
MNSIHCYITNELIISKTLIDIYSLENLKKINDGTLVVHSFHGDKT